MFSAGWLFVSLLIGSVGFVLFVYGKKQSRLPHLLTGLALMLYPYFVASVFWMVAVACLILAALWLAVRQGW
jgi:hypothetical protein